MIRELVRYVFLIIVSAVLCAATECADSKDLLVFISAFAPGDDGAIHAYQLNVQSGQLKPVYRTTGVEHPFFMAVTPDRKFLYSIHAPGEFGGQEHEQVAAYKVEGRTGQ